MTILRSVIAILLLCCTASADGPLFSIWHIEGHGYQWQRDQIDAGLPLEFSLRMPTYPRAAGAAYIATLEEIAPTLTELDGQAISIRLNNITKELDLTIPRINPLTPENWRDSPLCIRIRPTTGELDDTPLPCPFAPTDAWAEAGRKWATSRWMVRLQELLPNPSGVILRENNEGARLVFNNLRIRLSVAGQITWPWKSKADLEAICIRTAEWVEARRHLDSSTCQQEFIAAENAHYYALYAAFDANLSSEWQGKLRTVGYGGYAENRQNDAASVTLYLGYYVPPELTSPDYALKKFAPAEIEYEASLSNPQSWREWSVSCYPKAIYTGAVNGTHDVVDPESYAGFMTHAMWRMQHPGHEVRLTYWDSYDTPPSALVITPEASIAACNAIGRPDLLELTIEDYEIALLRAMDRIHDNPLISRYWREGTTTVLGSSLNTPTSVKVYATETTIPGERQTLLCVYTPCSLVVKIDVGGWRVPAKRLAYYLTGAVVEIE